MSNKKKDRILLLKQIRILVMRVSLVILIVIAALAMAINRFWPDFTEKYKTGVGGMMFPVTQLAATVAKSMDSFLEGFSNVIYVNSIVKNSKELEKQNYKARLQIYLMKQEMAKLKEKLNFLPEPDKKFYTARIAARSPGPIVNAGYIKSDDIDKISKDNVVVNEDGLVGQIEAVETGLANVILITDKRSNVPVKSKNYGKRAILVGTGTKNPRLDYIISTNKLSLGEEILTSGDGGIFPPDIPVGYVKEINKGQVLIETYVDWSALDYVFILK